MFRTETATAKNNQGMQTKESQDVDQEPGRVSLDLSKKDQPVDWDGLEAESWIYMICSAIDGQQSNANSFVF